VGSAVISLLTDFGLRDPSAAICRGVILGLVPQAQVIDISHEVRKYAVRDGALLLWCALPYLPVGVHVGVIDPGVGTARRPIAIRVGRGDILIGPDNGLLLPATEQLGGMDEVRELVEPGYRLPTVSASFHGRDIFAPAAAHLARGVPFESLGPALDPGTLVRPRWPAPRRTTAGLETFVLYRDTFGNAKFGALASELAAALGPLEPGDPLVVTLGGGSARAGHALRVEQVTWQLTFGAVPAGVPVLYEDSYGRLCLADNQGDAVSRLGLVDDLPVIVARRGGAFAPHASNRQSRPGP
jgi:S-adenosylmethionine hydrolase